MGKYKGKAKEKVKSGAPPDPERILIKRKFKEE